MAKLSAFQSDSKALHRELTLFSQEEQQILQQNFRNLAKGQKNVERNVLEKALLQLLSVPYVEFMVRRLCDLMTGQMKGMQHITYEGYVHCAAVMVKGMLDEKSGQILYLASGRKSYGTADEIQEFVVLVLKSYLQLSATEPAFQCWNTSMLNRSSEDSINRLAEAFLQDLVASGSQSFGSTFNADSIKQWLSKCYQMAEMQDILSHRVFHLPYNPIAPFVPISRGIPSRIYPSWLEIGDIIFINSFLPLELRNEWRFLFSSRVHGESFSSLLGSIVDKGPSIIVIKDNGGNIFGGFASTSWTISPNFGGTERNFIFSLYPRMAVYNATGFNNHYQYLNAQQQTLPNGLGMGGQLGYFGLWIDAEYGQGRCAPSCTTFGCPELSASPHFRIDRLEVWAVGPEPFNDLDEMEDRPSILDSDIEGAAILRMLNRGPVSEGLRENPTSDGPEDKSMPLI